MLRRIGRNLFWWISTLALCASAVAWITNAFVRGPAASWLMPDSVSSGGLWATECRAWGQLQMNSTYLYPPGKVRAGDPAASLRRIAEFILSITGPAQPGVAQQRPKRTDWRFAGFSYSSARTPDGAKQFASVVSVSVPWWAIIVASLPGTISLILAAKRRRRLSRGPTACKQCGYDLRAGHARCPECGAASHVPEVVT